jgi:heme/copper-type cytochrome/quinol oxidase subunit 1
MTSLEPTQRNFLEPRVTSKWSNRFIWAAIIQGLAATLLTIPIVWPSSGLFGLKVSPAVAQVIASGSAGTWYTVGYLSYIMVGVIAVGLTALFYYHFEVAMGKPYKGLANYFAWIHLVLMNVGVAAAAYLLMWGGYFGGAALLTGQTAEWVHVNILSGLVNPIGYSIIVAGVGVLAGGIGYVINFFFTRR